MELCDCLAAVVVVAGGKLNKATSHGTQPTPTPTLPPLSLCVCVCVLTKLKCQKAAG